MQVGGNPSALRVHRLAYRSGPTRPGLDGPPFLPTEVVQRLAILSSLPNLVVAEIPIQGPYLLACLTLGGLSFFPWLSQGQQRNASHRHLSLPSVLLSLGCFMIALSTH